MLSASTPLTIGDSNLTALDETIGAPAYDREQLVPSIVHIGVGGFHRAHLATYVHELCTHGHTDWSIVGAGVLPGDARMAATLSQQDGMYTLIVRGPEHTEVEIIGSIVDYLRSYDDPQSLIDQVARPTTQLVSLTITEGGYPIDDTTGDYRSDSPVAGPSSTFALIAAGLDARRAADAGAVTVLSCDNIMSNGDAARTATLGAAAEVSDDLVAWIHANVSFPNSMVDRITPATEDSDRAWLVDHHGVEDGWPVVTEPFRQWVIEDRFAGARLPLEKLDVIVTDDVAPYEHMKLRLLNAGHSCLAYLAALDGIESVDAAMADPHLRRFVQAFLEREALPVLPSVVGIDLDEYIASLVERFSNPNIGDQISRLCLDGSAKFPKFLLPTLRDQLARTDADIELAALALAGWCQYLGGSTLAGQSIDLAADPLLDVAVAHAARSADEPAAFLEFDEVFDPTLSSDPRLAEAFTTALEQLRRQGLRASIDAVLT